MNAAAAGNGTQDGPRSERERLFAEIAELKTQRSDLMRKLAACQRENRELRAQLEGRD